MSAATKTTRAPAKKAKTAGGHAGKQGAKWIIDISVPAGDRILDPAAFEKFLHDRIKIENGKPGQFGDKVKIAREGEERLVVTTTIPFSKRYLKFLTTKFLKKAGTRDFLLVHATSKNEYKIDYEDKTAGQDEDDE